MTGRLLVALELLILALVRVRARVLSRRRRLPAAGRRCRGCGCAETHACIEITLCDWVEPDLCSSCASCAELEPDLW